MHNFIKFIASVLCTVLICSCSLKNRAGTEITQKEYETDVSSVYSEVIRFAGFNDKNFQEEINSSIEKDVNSALISFDTAAMQSANNVRMGNKCVLEIRQSVKNNSHDFISVIEEHYVYTGGAHGSTAWYPRNIDISANKLVSLPDLFNTADYTEELNRQINLILDSDKEQYKDLWEHPVVNDNSFFYINGQHLVIFYQPYELSYYARGFVEFPIKLANIEGMLKDEYKRLVNN